MKHGNKNTRKKVDDEIITFFRNHLPEMIFTYLEQNDLKTLKEIYFFREFYALFSGIWGKRASCGVTNYTCPFDISLLSPIL